MKKISRILLLMIMLINPLSCTHQVINTPQPSEVPPPLTTSELTHPPTIMPNFPMLAGTNVMIMWLPVPGAVKYKIYMNGIEIGESAPGLPFNAPAPTDAGVYRYTVSGVDANGVEGPRSAEGKLEIIELHQPNEITHQFLGYTLYIRWNKVPGAAIYDIYRAGPYETKDKSDGAKAQYKLISSVTETRYVDNEVKESEEMQGKTYFYKIVAKDKFNKSSPDSEFYRVDIEKPKDCEGCGGYNPRLKIRRTKQVMFGSPMTGPMDISKNYDSKFNRAGTEMIYIDFFKDKIGVLDRFAEWVRYIGKFGEGEGEYNKPSSISVDPENGNIIITDLKKEKFYVFNEKYEQIGTYDVHHTDEVEVIESTPRFKTKPDLPTPEKTAIIGFKRYKDILVAVDSNIGVIQLYDAASYEFIDYLKDAEGNYLNGGMGVSSVALSENGKLYCGSSPGRIIKVIDVNSGENLYDIGIAKTFVGSFAAIMGINFDPDGNVIVADTTVHTVQVFNKDTGEYMYHIGDEKAIPDKGSRDQRAYVKNFVAPAFPNFDAKGRLWLYVGYKQGGSIREYVSDDIRDIIIDKPGGKSPQPPPRKQNN
ncbi:6-bladed beta-propeller [Thermodesulfobacteriota bacterium]